MQRHIPSLPLSLNTFPFLFCWYINRSWNNMCRYQLGIIMPLHISIFLLYDTGMTFVNIYVDIHRTKYFSVALTTRNPLIFLLFSDYKEYYLTIDWQCLISIKWKPIRLRPNVPIGGKFFLLSFLFLIHNLLTWH